MRRGDPPAISLLLRETAFRLASIEAGNPRLEAEYLLAAALRMERAALHALAPETRPDEPAYRRFEELLEWRLARAPLQYVLGTVPFGGLDLVIGPGALIPRGETEVLVEETRRGLRAIPRGARAASGIVSSSPVPAPVVVNVGTGSGAILLALLQQLPDWRGIGIDRAPEALVWARANRDRVLGASSSRAVLLRADLLAPIRSGSAAAVVSNPPYVRSGEIPLLAPEIREHEPRTALDGGPDGLDPLRRLVPEAARVLLSGGLFAVELAPDQPRTVAEILAREGCFDSIRVFLDLAGRERGVLARRT